MSPVSPSAKTRRKRLLVYASAVVFASLIVLGVFAKNDWLPTRSGKSDGFVDPNGNIVIEPQFRDVSWVFNEGFAGFCERGKCGFINKKGEKAIPAEYDYVERFTEGLAHIELGGKHGFINQQGQVVIPIKYRDAGTFECGMAYVEVDDQWTYIDKTGKFLFPLRKLK